jgi:transposase
MWISSIRACRRKVEAKFVPHSAMSTSGLGLQLRNLLRDDVANHRGVPVGLREGPREYKLGLIAPDPGELDHGRIVRILVGKGSELCHEIVGDATVHERSDCPALLIESEGSRAVAARLGVDRKAVLRLYDRWRVRGDTALVTKPGRRLYSFELKLSAVQRYISGENRVALAKELDLSSSHVIAVRVGQYRAEGEEGLRPKPKGRPRKNPDVSAQGNLGVVDNMDSSGFSFITSW